MPLLSYACEGQLMPKAGIFCITPELQRVLDSVPEQNDPRSKLDPFKPYILKWRRQGKTYRKIQQILRVECRMPVAYETLRQFVKSRSKPRKLVQPEIDLEPATVQSVESSSAAVSAVERKPRMTPEERAALRASFDQPLFPTEEKKPLFVRTPGPIRNHNYDRLGDKGNGGSIDTNSGDGEKTRTNK